MTEGRSLVSAVVSTGLAFCEFVNKVKIMYFWCKKMSYCNIPFFVFSIICCWKSFEIQKTKLSKFSISSKPLQHTM